jgi:hypothetical protein
MSTINMIGNRFSLARTQRCAGERDLQRRLDEQQQVRFPTLVRQAALWRELGVFPRGVRLLLSRMTAAEYATSRIVRFPAMVLEGRDKTGRSWLGVRGQ